MNPPRVFMICRDEIVGDAIRAALQEQGVSIIGVEFDPHKAQARIFDLNPDVILMEGDALGDDFAPSIWRALHALRRAGTRIIHISPHDNQIQIYRQEQKSVYSALELAQTIQMSGEEKI